MNIEFAALTRRCAPALAVAGALLAVALLTRVALALRPEVRMAGYADFAHAFGTGLAFDLATAAWFAAPLALWLVLAPDALARTRTHRMLVAAAAGAALYVLAFVAVSEWIFWDEFGARFNFIAVDYLLYTQEVIGNIRESYPVGRILAALALLAAAAGWLLRRALWRGGTQALAWRTRLAGVALLALALSACWQLIDQDLKQRRPGDTVNELAGNGIYDFFAALRRNELSWERNYATLPPDEALAIVRAALAEQGDAWVPGPPGSVERHVQPHGAVRPLNVVLISVESLGAEFLGAYGDKRGLTPNLDRLAADSLWFANAYATGNRTVRGLEALSLSLPPTPGQSIVRRPANAALFSLGSVLEDRQYAVMFAYGGYGYFDNMNAFFDANDYRSIDRRSIPAARIEFENVWGVADEHLYDQVIDELDAAHAARPSRPVFVHVMSTSNHRPYTYPAGRVDIASGSGREGAVKYTDYALGRFVERARSHAWFRDTLFVITADHGANARGTAEIPIDKYRIPVFMYAPAHLAPRRVDRLMSQIDIAPTILGLLNLEHYSKFLGRDVLRAPPGSDRAFVGNFQTVGYMKDGRLVTLQPRRRTGGTWRFDAQGRMAVAPRDLALEREAIAFYQTASHLFASGLYRDEEQLPPARRGVAAPAQGMPR
ncbi:MAG: LTA synthase family protein [Betaproteobacteria bacterium]|nr:LTA synthase family protein [Betaproteobacteria bacterium]